MPKLTPGAASDSSSNEDYELIPEDEVVAVNLADVEEMEMTFTNDQTGQPEKTTRLKWSFVVSEPGPWQGKTVTGMSSTSFVAHPNCKAYNWASALMSGKQFADNETLDTDDLIGKPGRVIIKHNKKNDRTYENVGNVLQSRQGSVAVTDAPF